MKRLRQFDIEALLPLAFSLFGFTAIAPFVLIRSVEGQYVVAAINALVSLTFLIAGWVIYRHHAVRPASVALALICTAGIVVTIHIRGVIPIYWAYPVIVSMFFLLRPLEALALSSVITLVALRALLEQGQTGTTAVVILSIVNTIGHAAAFSALNLAQRRKLRAMTLLDPLTGTCNRRAMDQAIPELIADSKSAAMSHALIMLDIDHFKRINDKFGHAAGDRVLIAVAGCIDKNTRASDRLFRVGGEEFAVVVEGAGLNVARRLSETLREAVAALEIQSRADPAETLQVTISLGVAELQAKESADGWYKRADDALYEAKRSGRNRTFLAGQATSPNDAGALTAYN